jgi:hypothetical protein
MRLSLRLAHCVQDAAGRKVVAESSELTKSERKRAHSKSALAPVRDVPQLNGGGGYPWLINGSWLRPGG